MALGSAYPLTEMSSRDLLWEGGTTWPAVQVDKLTAICEAIVYKM
jgi:hypothetical protein